jgi:hypothetical protein
VQIAIYQYILLLACFLNLFIFKNVNLKYFKLFLCISILFEIIIGKYLKYTFNNNIISTNIYVTICIVYYLFLYLGNYHMKLFKSLSFIYMLIFIISVQIQGIHSILTISYNFGMILVMVSIFIYLYNLIILGEFVSLVRLPRFWIACGILLFYSSLFPLLFYVNQLMVIDLEFTGLLFRIVSIGNIFLTLGYLFATLCQTNIEK